MRRLILVPLLTAAACSNNTSATPAPASQQASAGAARPIEAPAAQPAPANTPRPSLQRAQPLPALMRSLLRERMQRHGENMEGLLWSTLMLDYDSTRAIADMLLEEPRIARPDTAGAEGTLNEWLPAPFFDLQDRLYASTADLSKAAAARDDAAMADAYGRVAQTCVSCHALYLRLPPPPEGEPRTEDTW